MNQSGREMGRMAGNYADGVVGVRIKMIVSTCMCDVSKYAFMQVHVHPLAGAKQPKVIW